MATSARSLQLSEAQDRFDLVRVTGYGVTLDLTTGDSTFSSRCVIGLESGRGSTFLDVKPVTLHRLTLDGAAVETGLLAEGRVPLELGEGSHELVVEATMPFRNDGEGLHRSVDPADGNAYVYAMSFLDAAPTIFGCFDQPDLKAPFTFHVTAPEGWLVRGNAVGEQVAPGHWEFARTQPLSTYFVSLLAGPYHLVSDAHDGIGLGLSARASLAAELDAQAPEILTVTRQCFDEYHRLFGVRYAFGDYHQAFVPEFNAGAMENPGLVTFRDQMIFTSRATRSEHIHRTMVIAHEMAHQWFGNLVTLKWWDDLWLNESFAEYMGYRVAGEATEFTDALVENACARKVWGLTADSRPCTHPVAGTGAVDAAAALQDFDGISYAKGSAALRQLATRLGDEVFLGGVREHFARHRFGNATMRDLFSAWEDAGAGGLSSWTDAWLRTSGMDRLTVDRAAGVVRRTAPEGQSVRRTHALHVASHDGDRWQLQPLLVDADVVPLPVAGPDDGPEIGAEIGPGIGAVVLDPYEETWADLVLDETTVAALPGLIGTIEDPLMRASVWNTLRFGVHQRHLRPSVALDVVCAGLPTEDQDCAVEVLVTWSTGKLLALVADPATASERLNTAFTTALRAAGDPGAGLALAATHGVIATASDVGELRGWLTDGIPGAAPVDVDLRWRILRRLTLLGATDAPEIDARLAAEPRAESRIHHAWCSAALATPEAKTSAWRRFTGEVDVPNHELEASGLGFWQTGQDAVRATLVAPYVDRYFAELPDTAKVRQGWVLGSSTRAFFPLTVLESATTVAAERALAADHLDLTLRRALVEEADELEHRIAAKEGRR